MIRTVPARIVAIPAQWRDKLLICKNCAKRIGGGFGPKHKTALAKALRAQLAACQGGKAPRSVVEIGCLAVCADNAVTIVDGSRPGNWLVVQRGSDVAELAVLLSGPYPE